MTGCGCRYPHMRRSCILPVIAACVLISCGRNDPAPIPAQPAATATPMTVTTPPLRTPPPTPSPSAYPKVAERFRGAMVGVSVFDSSGKLSANGTGIFVADDGKIVVDRSVV